MKCALRWGVWLLALAGLLGLSAREAHGLDRGWYVNGGLGFNHLDVESSIRTEPDMGYRLVAAGGFQFNRNFGLELDTGYIYNTYSESSRASQRDNPLRQVPVVLTGVWSFVNASRVEPFVGLGAGLVFMSYGELSSGGDAVLSFRGGARYLLSDRWGLGADYTFFMLGATSALVEEPVGADTMNLTLHWMF